MDLYVPSLVVETLDFNIAYAFKAILLATLFISCDSMILLLSKRIFAI